MQRITYFERQIIESGVRCGKSVRAVARSLNRDHRVIQREVDRNTGDGRAYTAVTAEQMANERERRKNVHKLERHENERLREYVVGRLKDDWSPEQIAGILEECPPGELQGKTVSHESIYQYIYNGEGRFERLWPHLRKAKKQRQKRYSRRPQNSGILERISIHERPEEINDKVTFGHWESDTIECGKLLNTEVVSVQYERKSQLVRIHRANNKGAGETENAIRKSIESLPEYLWKSITFDNGTEGARHTKIRDDYGLQTFFCDPYSSWQKGGVENMNGLIRQYIPKQAVLCKFTPQDIYAIQEKLNNRPRKSLNYLTPNQVMAREVGH